MKKINNFLKKQKNIKKIGKLVTFVIPSKKINKKIRKKIHNFFVDKHKAYTHEYGEIFGYWLDNNYLIEDKHEKFEIAIREENDLLELVNFICIICKEIKEKAVYLTIGDESYLINPVDF